MALYNLKSLGSLTPKVPLAGAAGARRKIRWSLGGNTHSRGKRLAKFLCLFVFLGVRGLLVRAHTNPNPIRLHTRCFNPSQLQWGRSQRMWTSDGSHDVLLIKKNIPEYGNAAFFFFEPSSECDDSVRVYNIFLFFFLPLSLFYSFRQKRLWAISRCLWACPSRRTKRAFAYFLIKLKMRQESAAR